MKISGKWVIVCIYSIGIFVAVPYLPKLIRFATARWSSSGVSRFVLSVEIVIAFFILSLAIYFLIYKREKSFFFFISICGILLLSIGIYQFLPNPYEFTHLPEYAILSILIVRALEKGKVKVKGLNGEVVRDASGNIESGEDGAIDISKKKKIDGCTGSHPNAARNRKKIVDSDSVITLNWKKGGEIHKGILEKKIKDVKFVIMKNHYFLSGLITGLIGTGDEIYQHFLPNRFFNLYDIFLNILGGILGLLIFWRIKQ